MKFYYNGQLVRSSKNHIYTHAVIDTATGKAVGCRVGRDNAEAIIRSEIAHYEKKISNYTNAIKAMESGKSGYYCKDDRHTYYTKFSADSTIEQYRQWIEWNRDYINKVKTNWQVVELEAR